MFNYKGIKKYLLAALIASIIYAGMSFLAPPHFILAAIQKIQPLVIDNKVNGEEENIISVIDKALPSVVNVVGSQVDKSGEREIVARGTGFVIDSSGLLLTNRHVVSQSNLLYTVYFNNGARSSVTVAALDPLNDIAILKVTATGYKALPLGDSDKIRIGQTVIAIGNSLGRYANTVTKGIISGKGRSVSASDNITGQAETLADVIQTDAAINLGNSGGPLLNSAGEVLGINTAIDQLGRSVGFAIPINDAKRVLESYKKNGKIVRSFLGVRYIMVSSDIQDQRKLNYDYGALIYAGDLSGEPAVIPDSPADRAGLKEGDLILTVNSKLVARDNSLLDLVQKIKPGDIAKLTVVRGRTVINIHVVVGELPAYKP